MKMNFNRKRILLWVVLVSGLLVFGGCSDSGSILKSSEEVRQEEESADNGTDSMGETGKESEDGVSESEDRKTEPDEKVSFIYVDICGAVNAPGVYQLPAGSRVFQVIQMAGGFSEQAAADWVNQAGILEDGQQLRILTVEEARAQKESGAVHGTAEQSGQQSGSDNGTEQSSGKVNINTADIAGLMTLEGIGKTRAEAIISYRESHGGFSAAEDLMQVEGIKEKTFEKLKDKITID